MFIYDTKFKRILRNYYKIDDSNIDQKHRPPSRDISYGYHINPSDINSILRTKDKTGMLYKCR